MPPMANISFSDVSHAFTIQLGEGTNLTKRKGSLRLGHTEARLRPKYTLTLLGCFLNMEYSAKRTTQTPVLIPTEVKSAEMFISDHYIFKLQATHYPRRWTQHVKIISII